MRRLLGLSPRVLRAAARALLLVLGLAALGPLAHGVHADECDTPVVFHDEGAHALRGVADRQPAMPDDHCVACHFARSTRAPLASHPARFGPFEGGALLPHADGRLAPIAHARPLAARAPPALA